MNPTLRLVVHGDVRWAPQESRPPVDHVDSTPVLQVLSASLQRFDEVFIWVGADHPSLQKKYSSEKVEGVKKKKEKVEGVKKNTLETPLVEKATLHYAQIADNRDLTLQIEVAILDIYI